jgi:hypothetical protein
MRKKWSKEIIIQCIHIEGSRRIEAAKRLNLPVELIVCDDDDVIVSDCYDATDEHDRVRVADLVNYLTNGRMPDMAYSEDDFVSITLKEV